VMWGVEGLGQGIVWRIVKFVARWTLAEVLEACCNERSVSK
jgi:hypothetical protein